ncbi:MAG: hypothetical protein C4517_10105 [Stygiobacter sp.]|nr:MAG: hypothetical protein C4517_10105 [Stygiobacter sp.]
MLIKEYPSIGLVTTSTNSLSRGYLGFFACIDSWSKVVDEIVIVDGGTTDTTYEVLDQWCERHIYRIVSDPVTYWNLHGCWHLGQWDINTKYGLDKLNTDWAVVVPADTVVDVDSAKNLKEILLNFPNEYYLKFNRKRFSLNDQIQPDVKWYIINLKKLRSENIEIGWGIDSTVNTLSDYPLILKKVSRFIDPINNIQKSFYSGIPLISNQVIPIITWSYGFYFFRIDQALNHLKDFYSIYVLRYMGNKPQNNSWFMTRENLLKCSTHVLRSNEFKKPHIHEIKRLLDVFYSNEMIGIMFRERSNNNLYVNFDKASKYIYNFYLWVKKFPYLNKYHEWYELNSEAATILDIKRIYKLQDEFLPLDYKINWSLYEK